MKATDTIAMAIVAVAMIVVAGITRLCNLWSVLANLTVPWFCGAVAIALLLVVMTAVLCGCTPQRIPLSRVLVVSIGAALAVGGGMLVDRISYGNYEDLASSAGEWVAFVVMLGVLFWIPRVKS